MDIALSPRAALSARVLGTATLAVLCGCNVPYLRLDAARAGVIVDREGARGDLTVTGVEMGGPRAPSQQAVTFSIFERLEYKPAWLRMAVVGQARFYALRWLVPCQGHDCDVVVGGTFAPKSGPFHTAIAGRHGAPVNALYLGKNNLELFSMGSLLEGDLSVSGPLVKSVDSKSRHSFDWWSSVDRPRVLAGFFVTTSPPLLGGYVRLGAEGGAQYDGLNLGMFGRFWVGFGMTNAPSPPRLEDVPAPHVRPRS